MQFFIDISMCGRIFYIQLKWFVPSYALILFISFGGRRKRSFTAAVASGILQRWAQAGQ
jgi:hypothetical protein